MTSRQRLLIAKIAKAPGRATCRTDRVAVAAMHVSWPLWVALGLLVAAVLKGTRNRLEGD